MRKRILLWFLLASLGTGMAQRRDIIGDIMGGERPALAIPVFRGSGEADKFMSTFNDALNLEIEDAGVFKSVSRSMMPRGTPQQPQDFKTPGRSGNGGGFWLTDWSSPPAGAKYLAFGYTGVQGDRMVLFGWLYDVTQTQGNPQVLGKIYFGAISDDGAKQVAREFAADILGLMGAKSLAGSKIYFVTNRAGEKQIWVMDYDGTNQKPFAPYRELCTMPSVSADGLKIAFTRFSPGGPQIMVHNSEGRRLPFLNPAASLNATLSFAPDGSKVVFASKVGGFAQLHTANADGGGLHRLSNTRAIEVEPKINPKTGADLVFVSGRSGPQQIYRMNMDGADVARLTSGEGQASNPSWHPDGKFIAFSWTRGLEPGNWNVFIMDVTRPDDYLQLTSGRGRNENPTWGPDGKHIVFASTRGGSMQIYTMLADGANVRRLTSAGRNEMPVWSK